LLRFPLTTPTPLPPIHPQAQPQPNRRYDNNATLFIGNLPADVTEREMSILFRFYAGFNGIRLVIREGRPPIGFADFDNLNLATLALNALQGFKLDKDHAGGLSLEFDRGNVRERDNSYRDRDRDRDLERERDKNRPREREPERDHHRK